MIRLRVIAAALLLSLMVSDSAFSAEPLKWVSNGSFIRSKIGDKWAEFEAAAGLPIEFTSYKQDLAFINLAHGRVDFITSGPIVNLIKETKEKIPSGINADHFESIVFTELKIKVAINPEVKVRALTTQQFSDIFAGRLTTWKPITGQDIPIKLFVAQNSPVLMKAIAAKYSVSAEFSGAQFVADQEGVARAVKLSKGAIGLVSSQINIDGFKPTYIDTEAVRSTFLSIRKAGRKEAQKVIDFIKKSNYMVRE